MLLMPTSSDTTTVVYLLRPLDGNAPNLHFSFLFFFGKQKNCFSIIYYDWYCLFAVNGIFIMCFSVWLLGRRK